MPTLQIRARFPLGVYRGHRGRGGVLSPAPETSRLFAALVHAAGTGSTAVVDGRHLRPSAESIEALTWLETHPPSALILPTRTAINHGYDSYRAEGVFEGSGNRTDRKVRKVQSDGVGVPPASAWEWRWDDVPADVVKVVIGLSEEVSCLGEAESVVVLEASTTAPTHELAVDVGRLTPGPYTRVPTPMPGHFDELEDAHRARFSAKPPKKDAFAWTSRPGAASPTQTRIREVAYRLIGAEERAQAPWAFALHVPVGRDEASLASVSPRDHVRLCAAMHAALATRLGDDAPPVITGRYAAGLPRPANRVAIHFFPRPIADLAAGFLLMLPIGIEDGAVTRLRRALLSLPAVFASAPGRRASWRFTLGEPALVSCETFWAPPLPGMRRLWGPVPAVVPEVTRQGREWQLDDAILLALAYVCRDQLRPVSGKDRYRDLVHQVREAGARVITARHLADSRADDYVHRMTKGVPVRPLHALVDPGHLLPERAIFALGQSRHLGGGLMVPVDVPAGTDERGCDVDA